MHIIIFPLYTKIIAVGIRIGINADKRLRHNVLRIFDENYVIARAVNILRAFFKKTSRILFVEIQLRQLIARIIAVSLGIMVAVDNSPVTAERIHKLRKFKRPCLIVKGARLKRNGIRHVTRNNYKIRLLFLQERRHGTHGKSILVIAHPTAADMHVRQLNYAQITIGRKGPIAVAVLFGCQTVGRIVDRLKGRGEFELTCPHESVNGGCDSGNARDHSESTENNFKSFFAL